MKTKPAKRARKESSSKLLQLDPEIWAIILEFVTDLYWDSLRRTSKFFAKKVESAKESTEIEQSKRNLFIPPYPRHVYFAMENNYRIKYIRWALENGADVNYNGITHIVEKGRLDILKVIYTKQQPKSYSVRIGEVAALNGHLNFIEWLNENNCVISKKLAKRAATGGHLQIIQLLEKLTNIGQHRRVEYVKCAVMKGHIHILEWVRIQNKGEVFRDDNAYWSRFAVSYGQLEVLKWFYQHGYTINTYAASLAIDINRLDILKWVIEVTEMPISQDMVERAAIFNRPKEMMDYFAEQGFTPSKI